MFLNDDIVNIEKPDRVCSPTVVVDEFSTSDLHKKMILYQSFDIDQILKF